MVFNSATEHHLHLSPDLHGNHDSSIPLYLVLTFGFCASFICGVLNFGESMTFTLLWNFARYMSWLGPDVTYAKGVIYSQVEFFVVLHTALIMFGVLNFTTVDLFCFDGESRAGTEYFCYNSASCCWLEGGSSHGWLQQHHVCCYELCKFTIPDDPHILAKISF
jgi:hypothetical protein